MALENLNQIEEESNENQQSLATCASEMTKEIIYSNTTSIDKKLRILHFNDVYNIDPSPREPKAGAARFLTAINYLRDESQCVLLFSGDVFSPSTCN